MAGTWNITIEQGCDFQATLVFKNDDGTPINLTGYDAEFSISETVDSPEPTILATIENGMLTLTGPTGTVSIHIPNSMTADLAFQHGVENFRFISPSGIISRMTEGTVTYSKDA